ncbi:Protein FAR1-RELATED SEQUENCE 5 [Bienertia sinuspersici]
MKPIEGGDAQAVIDKLYQNMSDDLEFFFRVHVDGYGRVSSIFWRDSMMKEDYNIYGDVTNLTQHTGQTVPTTIFTDQDTAMTKAIAKKKDASFEDAFQKCLSGCSSEEEFEKTWHQMITKYNLEKSKWFSRLYALKEKWATALSKDFFSAGILSSQRSESTNNAIGFRACKTTSLNEFFAIYEATIKRWRSIEESNEFICSKSIPRSNLPMCGLLKHAAEVYTHTLFRHFEQEFEASMTSEVTKCSVIGNMLLYEVRIEDNNNRLSKSLTYK